ncbi:MAG: MMPL family transporter [Myxococcales bacterium]|nr:MMPL family transporter [Myxococcales bacterium]
MTATGRRAIRAAIGFVLLAVLVVVCWRRLAVTTDITHFMADETDAKLAGISRELAQSELTRTMILSVQADDPAAARAGARALAAALAGHPEVAWLRVGPGSFDGEGIHRVYFPHRLQLLADPAELSDEGLRAAARELKRELGKPSGTFIKKVAPRDPLLLYPRQLKALEAARGGGLTIVDGQFMADETHALVMLATHHSPFDAEAQRPLQAAIEAGFAEADAAAGGGLTLGRSAVARFALAAEQAMRDDISRISTVSTIGLLLLFVAVFRWPHLIVLAMLPLPLGVAAALAACLLIFGSVHGLTLAFGATLIGVCIDYSVHLLNHHLLDRRREGAEASARRIAPGLWLGALTTIAGFAGLAWTSFPGLREVAVFASVGVLVAALATLYWLPAMLSARAEAGRLQRAAASGVARAVEALGRRRRVVAGLPLTALLVAAIGLPQIRWTDDIKLLTVIDPAMLAEDERVRASVARMDGGRFVVAIGEGATLAAAEAAALDVNDSVRVRLAAARAAGELEEFRSLHTFVPGPTAQAASLNALRAPGLAERLDAAFVAEGFNPGSFAGFFADVAQDPGALTLEVLAGSPLGDAVRPFRVELARGGEGHAVAILSFVRGVKDGASLARRLADTAGAHYFDQQETMAAAYGRYRERTLELVTLGLVAVLAMVWLRHRRLTVALAAFAPAVLAAGASLGALALAGVSVGLLHVVALLLVLSMGVDYGVFLAETRDDPEGFAATVLSVLIACTSTVLAFGLLAMSASPALRAIGVTVGLGVLLSLVLAPAALLLGGRR